MEIDHGDRAQDVTLTTQQDAWIAAQIDAGHYTNDSEAIRDLIRRAQERSFDLIEAACTALAEAPQQAQGCAHIRPGYRLTRYGIAIVRILHQRMDAALHP